MRASNYTIATLKETPADAEIASHQLLLRAGFIRKIASGIYTWLPMGFRVLRKIEAIIREEMDRSGAQEIMMPVVQPAELWHESGRWSQYDEGLLLKFQDRHERDFCMGPTHEEVITELARNELRSHKQLPVNLYQIQTKFRDETRPRFGVLRAREFTMKDGYSFHADAQSLSATYQTMHDTYSRILSRIGLDFRPVMADTGNIGGSDSHEFHVLAESGEDVIAFSDSSDYAANIELAEALAPPEDNSALLPLEDVATPGQKTIAAIVDFLSADITRTVKTLIVKGTEEPLVALVLRGDHQLNALKAAKLDAVADPLVMAGEAEIRAAVGCGLGSIGPVGLAIPVIADRSAAALKNFIAGGNVDDVHQVNINWQRDASFTEVADLRNVVEGDPSPDGKGVLRFKRGIEVGHIFALGEKYSKPMKATVLDENGKAINMLMGCYGMGVTRLVGAAVEQNHDDRGITWPTVIAPFEVVVIPVNAHKSEAVAQASEALYAALQDAGIEVLIDDRDSQRPGAKFADAELVGIPHRVVIGERGLGNDAIEYVDRRAGESHELALADVATTLINKVRAERT